MAHHIRAVGKYLNSDNQEVCEVLRLTGIEGIDVTKAFTPPLRRGPFFIIQMNKTKKRAAKRAALRSSLLTPPVRPRRRGFKWPYQLIPKHKIKDLIAFREYHHCSLSLALAAYNRDIESLCVF